MLASDVLLTYDTLESDELDLISGTPSATMTPKRPGQRFFVISGRFVVTELDGTITTPPTMRCGNDAGHLNVYALAQQISAASWTAMNTSLGAGETPPFAAAGGALNNLNQQLISTTNPFVWDITTAGVAGTATKCKARIVLSGIYV